MRLYWRFLLVCVLLAAGLVVLPAAPAAAQTSGAVSSGAVTGWGYNQYGQTTEPAGLTEVVAISAGGYHSVALRADGTVTAWGRNTENQTDVPAGLSGVIAIAAGGSHTVALKADGTVTAWGDNGSGQTDVPAGLGNVTAIAAGGNYTVALRVDGTVIAWGNNIYGQTDVPAGLSNVVAISAGFGHTVVLKSDGTVTAWGDNLYGQTDVPAGLSDVMAIAAGSQHTVALKTNGTVSAWGLNDNGQTTAPDGLSDVIAIAAGGFHTLALTRDAIVVAWGSNDAGQTTVPKERTNFTAIAGGFYHTIVLRTAGNVIAWGDDGLSQTTVPAGLSNVIAISAGGNHTMALLGDGTVVAWGDNSQGQTNVPAGLSDVMAISAGGQHSMALKTDGTVVAWGWNHFGQADVPDGLGEVMAIAAGGNHNVALMADTSVVAWGANYSRQSEPSESLLLIVAIAAGLNHGVALRYDGFVEAWGNNSSGQMDIPAEVNNVVSVAAGAEHTVALNSDGTVLAWGDNEHGQSTVPAGLGIVVAIAAGGHHTIALKADGTVIAWGLNTDGQTAVPEGLSNVMDIAAGANHTVVLYSHTSPPTDQPTAMIALDASTLSQTYTGSPRVVTATTTPAGLSYSVSYNGSAIPPANGGKYVVVATITDPSYAGSTSGILTVVRADQTIIVVTPAPASAAVGSNFIVGAIADSGLPVSYGASGTCGNGFDDSSTRFTVAFPGNCIVTYSQGGSINFNPAPKIVTVVPSSTAGQTISFTSTAPANAVYGDTYTPAATGGGSGNPVTFGASGACAYDSSSGAVTMIAAGVCTVTANQAADATYAAAAQETQSFSVARASLGVAANDVTMTYGGAVPVFDATTTGLVNGDSFRALGGTCSAEVAGGSVTASTSAGVYPAAITCSGVNIANYNVSYAPGTLTILDALEITSAAATTFTAGVAGSYTITASGYPTATFTATGTMPNGVSLSAVGVLSGTPTESGIFDLIIVASNGVAPDAQESFTLTVLVPAIVAPDDLTVPNDTGQAGAVVTYPAPQTIGQVGEVTCTPASGSFFDLGATTVTCVSSLTTAIGSFTVTVIVVNEAPVAVDDQASVTAGGPAVSIDVLANDEDPDESDTLSISGNTQPPANQGSVSCSETECTFTPDLDFSGETSFQYTLSDGKGGQDTATVAVTVAPANIQPTADSGGPYSVDEGGSVAVSATGLDTDGGTLTFAWDLDGDDVFETPGQNAIYAANDLDGPSIPTITVQVSDGDGGVATAVADVTIRNVAPTATFAAPAAVDEGSAITLALTDPTDPSSGDTLAGFSYAFDCGDGNGYGVFSTAPSANCPTSDDGARTVKGKIQDKDAGETEYSAAVTIIDVAPVIEEISLDVVNPGIELLMQLIRQLFGIEHDAVLAETELDLTAAFSDAGSLDSHIATIDWGDGTTTTNVDPASNPLATSHVYKQPGNYTITLTVSDDGGSSATLSVPVTVFSLLEIFARTVESLSSLASEEPDRALDAALNQLRGHNGGQASNGALDLLENSPNAALVKIGKALEALAGAPDSDTVTSVKQVLIFIAMTVAEEH